MHSFRIRALNPQGWFAPIAQNGPAFLGNKRGDWQRSKKRHLRFRCKTVRGCAASKSHALTSCRYNNVPFDDLGKIAVFSRFPYESLLLASWNKLPGLVGSPVSEPITGNESWSRIARYSSCVWLAIVGRCNPLIKNDAFASCNNMFSLQNDWDGEGSPSPSPSSINTALKLLDEGLIPMAKAISCNLCDSLSLASESGTR